LSGITELKNAVISYFDSHEVLKLSNTLNMVLNDPSFSLDQKLDILGELALRDPDFFMDNIYPFRPMTLRDLTPAKMPVVQFFGRPFPQVVEMEEYILKNYCFLEDEEIKTVINGSVHDKKTETKGRIYLTNYRLIVSGNQKVRSAQPKGGTGRHLSSIPSALIRSGITRHRKAVRKAISDAFRKDLKEWNIGEWGYYFPIYNAKDLKRGKRDVSYTVDVETEKGLINLKIKIVPIKLEYENKKKFQEQKEKALNEFYGLLEHYQ
jgi:hypothetical protein